MSGSAAKLNFTDGEQLQVELLSGESLLDAVERQQLTLPHSCREGTCGACIGRCTSGSVVMSDQAIAISEAEKADGYVLACQCAIDQEAELEFAFDSSLTKPNDVKPFPCEVLALERVAEGTMRMELQADLPMTLDFKAGQYLDLRVPGTAGWRSYSFVNLPNSDNRIELLLRILPESANGVMSEYLSNRAEVGDRIEARRAGGAFYLRDVTRPVLLIAGGTGLSAILSQLRQLAAIGCKQPVTLLYGVAKPRDLCLLDEIKSIGSQLAKFRMETIVETKDDSWVGPTGWVTNLLDDKAVSGGDTDIYLCGPPLMVDGVQQWLKEYGDHRYEVFFEKFAPSGNDDKVAVPAYKHKQPASAPCESGGKPNRHAIVIGGSIAGIMAAKALVDYFDKVTVLERDDHHPMEFLSYRPRASQTGQPHHLLQGGQEVINKLFPDFIDDFTKAGGNYVDSGRDFRFYQNDGWKVVFDSGMKICIGRRTLLEGVLRQQLDKYPTIEYRYNAEADETLLDEATNKVTGIMLREGNKCYQVDADLVVNASGKNTLIPKMLEQHGYQKPEETYMGLNAFYTTMLYDVPEHLRDPGWKVMVIYNRRPVEDAFAYACLYGDGSQLLVTVVQFDCKEPPRNHAEFDAVAKGLPQPHMYDLLKKCMPITEPQNFSYPTMIRRHFEKTNKLPEGIVCVGDAYASADPCSGAGMTKAALEVEALRAVLEEGSGDLRGMPKRYFASASKIIDDMWFILGEQNYRFPWVSGKRPFGLRFINWYVDQVQNTAHYDQDAFRRFLNVYHFKERYVSLFGPSMIWKVIKHTLTKSFVYKYNPAREGEVREPLIIP